VYVNDPSDLALLPEVKQDIILEEPRDYHEFFYDDQPPHSRRFSEDHRGIYTQICRFDQEGNHVTMAKDCPHFVQSDEEGQKIQKGWTAQVG
jgi:hypothetical protein